MSYSSVSKKINLHGQIAIITGGARGIGACIARTLAREGADVVVCDVLPSESIVAEIERMGRRAMGICCDVTNQEQVIDLVQKTLNHFGKIDILVANAGVVDRTPFLEMSLEGWKRVTEINLTGVFLTVQSVFRHMKERQSGKIVCIGSIAGKVGGVISAPNYIASKGGVHSFVKSVAKEGGPFGVYVNAVAPGPCDTDMNASVDFQAEKNFPLQRMGRAEDIAEAALFLVSPASNFITGQTLNVCGGVFME